MRRFPSLLCSVISLLLVIAVVEEASAQLRGARYCEVIAVHLRDGALIADVWNSLAAPDTCPQAEWEALDPAAIQQELGALAIAMNGPRFWVLDWMISANPDGPVRSFGAINMRLSATLLIPPGDASPPYTERSVTRDTQFLFRAGQEVYELIAPDDKVYVMQSYAHIVDDTLDEAALAQLGGRLEPPDGWRYRVRVLDGDYVVEDQAGIATVIQDELANTYQYFGFVNYPPGERLRVRQKRSGSQRLRLIARDPVIQPSLPCEVDGDLIVEAVGAAAEARRFPLETSGWRPIRRNQPERGCRYSRGPVVSQLRLKAGKLRVSALADDLGVPLGDDPTPVRIRLRHGEHNYCFVFGGEGTYRADKRLVARNGPATEACPATPFAP